MRYTSLIFIFLLMFSCGGSTEKKAGQENAAKNQAPQNEETLRQEYLQKGGEVANLSQAELLKNVSLAMNKGGAAFAIEFCNLAALPIKDSLSRLHNCQIQRIALKYRNPLDRPRTEREEKQLKQYRQASQAGEALKAEVYLDPDKIEYYQPIMIAMEACLKCHGEPGKHIAQGTLEKIKTLYPDDLATGFEMNDFRGAWKITFLRIWGLDHAPLKVEI